MKSLRLILSLVLLAVVSLASGACSTCHKSTAKTSCCAGGSCSK